MWKVENKHGRADQEGDGGRSVGRSESRRSPTPSSESWGKRSSATESLALAEVWYSCNSTPNLLPLSLHRGSRLPRPSPNYPPQRITPNTALFCPCFTVFFFPHINLLTSVVSSHRYRQRCGPGNEEPEIVPGSRMVRVSSSSPGSVACPHTVGLSDLCSITNPFVDGTLSYTAFFF